MNPYKQNLVHVGLFINFIQDQKRYSEHTIRAYRVDLNQLLDHLGEEISIVELTKYDLHEYISIISKSISSKSLSRKIATIKSLFKYLVNENIAAKHMNIALYYLHQKKYFAAMIRYNKIIDNHSKSKYR